MTNLPIFSNKRIKRPKSFIFRLSFFSNVVKLLTSLGLKDNIQQISSYKQHSYQNVTFISGTDGRSGTDVLRIYSYIHAVQNLYINKVFCMSFKVDGILFSTRGHYF